MFVAKKLIHPSVHAFVQSFLYCQQMSTRDSCYRW